MIEINLLPWREEQRNLNKKIFLYGVIISITIALFVILWIHISLEKKVNQQKYRNQVLQNEINLLASKNNALFKVKKQKKLLQQQLLTLQNLRFSRYQMVNLLNEITRIVPKGVFLQTLKEEDQQMIIVGQAHSNLLVSQFIKKIDASSQLKSPSLKEVSTTQVDGRTVINFKLTFEVQTNNNRQLLLGGGLI